MEVKLDHVLFVFGISMPPSTLCYIYYFVFDNIVFGIIINGPSETIAPMSLLSDPEWVSIFLITSLYTLTERSSS